MAERFTTSPDTNQWSRSKKMIGAASLMLAINGCSSAVGMSPTAPSLAPIEFNQPESAEYFLDSPDIYYENIKATLPMTDDPATINAINRLVETPISQWLNTSIETTKLTIEDNIQQSAIEGTIPVFVAYNIPDRDLGGEASGGLADVAEYQEWIEAISQTIGDTPSVIVLEPDAIGGVPQIADRAVQDERLSLLRGALELFGRENKNTAVYLDIGHSRWLGPEDAVDLIRRVDHGDNLVGGIALNVSNQRSNQETRAYAANISELLGRELYVMIDTSMNGAKNTDDLLEWCNADGERVGQLEDTAYSSDQLVEEMYIKAPGESDGRCGESNKIAGEFDAELFIKQVS